MVDRTSEALRDGEQAAREREQAAAEMEQGLIAQELDKQPFRIEEQADGQPGHLDDGEGVITATHSGGAGNTDAEADGATIGSPGAGTDPSETQTSSGGAEGLTSDERQHRNVELEGDERVFEGDGTRSLDEQ